VRQEAEGPSEAPKKKKQNTSATKQAPKKKKTSATKQAPKKKTPIKKKLMKVASAPEARVVRSLKSWLGVE
jgi:hypothetical protein